MNIFAALIKNIMFSKVVFIAGFIVLLACNQNQNNAENKASKGSSSEAGAALPKEQNIQKISFADLEKNVGKKPAEAKVFENFNIYARLEKMMGEDYKSLKAAWIYEEPLVKDIDVVYTSVCKEKDCTGERYFLLFDVMTNNINVFCFKDGHIRTFEESSIIGLTDNLSKVYTKFRGK